MSLRTLAMISARVEANFETARAYLDESIRLSHDAGMLWDEGVSRTDVGQVALLLGDYAQARKSFRECLRIFTESGDRQFANVARSGLAETERASGNWRAAATLYGECILSWRDLGSRGGIARCIECLAFIARGNGDTQRAARLLGAAETLREISVSPMTPEERAEYDRETTALRARIDENDLQAAWQEGRVLSTDEAIAYALGNGGTSAD